MAVFKAKEDGHYLSMTVNGHVVQIHDSIRLEKGERLTYPDDAHVLLIVANPTSPARDD